MTLILEKMIYENYVLGVIDEELIKVGLAAKYGE